MNNKIFSLWQKKPKQVVVIWLVLTFLFAALGISVGTKTVIPGPANLDTLLSNPGEKKAYSVGIPPKDSLVLVLGHEVENYDSQFAKLAREELVSILKNIKYGSDQTRVFNRIEYVDNTFLDEDSFVSHDRKYTIIKAHSNHSIDVSAREFENLPHILKAWQSKYTDFSLNYLSYGTVNNEMFELIHKDLDSSLIYSIPITFIILLWAFGSLVSALIPLLVAGLSLIMSLGLTAILSQVFGAVSATASQLVVLLVLAIGIDYALFFITRVREEVGRGLSYFDAVTKARQTTGLAIFWSGLIVALSLCGLFLMQDSVLASMSFVAIISVAITLFSAVYILPALLILLAEKLEWGRFKKHTNEQAESPKWLDFPLKKPIFTMFFTSVLLIFLASFSSQLKLGSTVEPEVLPRSMQTYQAFSVMSEKFSDLVGSDFSVLIIGENISELENSGKLDPFFDALFSHENVRGPIRVERSTDDSVARFKYLGLGDTNSPENKAIIENLRTNIFPNILAPLGISAYTGGTLTYVYDTSILYAKRTPLVFAVVLLLSFIFLLLAFRSVVVPIKAILLNLLSTLASFGVLVIFFQLDLIPAWDYKVIESFVPALLFSILFGLSMDYHVFLLARINEETKQGADINFAVKRSVTKTFKSITSAAFIMVAVFIIVASLQFPIMKELGVGLAFAVFIDATIIRCLLLPASMVLLGRWNWYLPKSLRWLPVVKMD